MSDDVYAVVLSLGAGFLFGLGVQCVGRGMRNSDPHTATLVDIGTSALFYWSMAPFFLKAEYWSNPAALIFAGLGLIRPFLSTNLAARAVHYLGPTLASTFSSTTPLFGAVLGVVLLGETLTLPIAAGTGAIIAALVLQTWRRQGVKSTWPLWALLFPFGAALVRSTGHALTKYGLAMLPSPMFAGLLSYSVSLVLAIVVQRATRSPMPNFRVSPGILWFVAAGLCHGTAVLTMNTALAIGKLIVVVPIVSTYPFFTLGLGILFFRGEVVARRTVVAVLLVVSGVLLVAIYR